MILSDRIGLRRWLYEGILLGNAGAGRRDLDWWKRIHRQSIVSVCAVLIGLTGSPTSLLASDLLAVDAEPLVVPFAEMEIIGNGVLRVEVPTSSSASSASTGLRFMVSGNGNASVSALPGNFIEIPDIGFIGKAVSGTHEIGYSVVLHFPRSGQAAGQQSSELPTTQPAGTPPLGTVLNGTAVEGQVDIEASVEWTADGSLPPPGSYTGEIVLMLSAF